MRETPKTEQPACAQKTELPSRTALKRELRRIRKRQAIGDGWDGAANDNQAWPMAKALLAEGNHDLLKYAMRYRQIEASATCEATLGGGGFALGDLQIDQRVHIRPNGEVAYKGVRKLTKDEPTYIKADGAPWSGDAACNGRIDDAEMLAVLRAALGPLVEPFEEACIHGATLEKVGRLIGVGSSRAAMSAARAMIHLSLITIRDCLGSCRRADLAA